MAQQAVVTKNRNVPLDKIRNVGIIAHIDSGKTTTTERFLFYTGKSYKIGDIDDGDTQMDWMPQERERGITIVSAATTTFWNGIRINIIDTPGHVDFTAEVERSLRVLDGGVVVFDAEEGVQSQSETVWRQADKYKVPRICFINKMDKLGANFEATVGEIEERLGAHPAIMTYPIGQESEFKGVIDLLTLKAKYWDQDEQGIKFTVKDEIPEDLKQKVTAARAKLVEKIAETDDKLLDKYLNAIEISVDELKAALRKAVIAYKLIPIYCGTSLRNKAVQPVLDAIVDYLPSPLDLKEIKGHHPKTNEIVVRQLTPTEKFSALAFKIQLDPHVGKITYARIYSGVLDSGTYVYNVNRDRQERVSRLLLMHANNREEIDKAYAGEIVALVGPKDSKTGDTLADQSAPLILEKIVFPEPVISLAIEPKTKADQEKLSYTLQRLAEEDPTFKVKVNHETGQTIMSGMGELHLEILVDRMKREMGMDVNVGKPQVAYKETVAKAASDVEVKYIKQTGGHGQYGHVVIDIEPLPRSSGFKFINKIKGGTIPSEFIPSVEKGVTEALEKGVYMGFPMTDLQVSLVDGSYHDVDSSDIAFKIAGSMALQEAAKRAGMILLEPIMKLEVTIPENFMGVAIGDVSSKRGKILGTEKRSRAVVIKSYVPLAELSGYATTIRSLTEGRGIFYMEPSHYEEVPKNIAQAMAEK
ncbi:MAG: Elongation factor G [Candidatus Roizmanbacteria bacterium GW2011_GWA2_35_19]|uniref:Elongation factor G n=2 Tax=Candidatus Roizmaniibacteriota TaxID=1752723 RepID=A0A0G0EC89_9BACT|nr:MAG: Elongation factor G [Candidatus Roizmanbacteria bacterium GW2011_GWC2_35_12]KKP72870.1 MAG: Elongation factor G [Candidatus Roizmanbacteria bacterium GW2011_GWA2_35_19]